MDVTEIAPAHDHGQSAMAVCQVIVDMLAAYAASHSQVAAGQARVISTSIGPGVPALICTRSCGHADTTT
jgi:hypothetical protein